MTWTVISYLVLQIWPVLKRETAYADDTIQEACVEAKISERAVGVWSLETNGKTLRLVKVDCRPVMKELVK